MLNDFVESFNGRLRAECLNETIFTLLGPCLVRAGRLAAQLQHGQATLQTGREDPRAEIAGQCVWGHAPRHIAIPPNNLHEKARVYL
jgi:putative transposase